MRNPSTPVSIPRIQVHVSFFGFIVIGMYGGGWGVLLPSVIEYYHINQSIVGVLFLTSAIGYCLSALSGGFLAHKLGLRGYLIFGVVVFMLGNLIFGMAPPFVLVILTRLLLGFGMAVIETGLNMFITALPGSTSLMNYLHAFYGVGALIGPLIASGALVSGWQWFTVSLIWMVFTLLLLLGVSVLFRFRLPGERGYAQTEVHEPVRHGDLRDALRIPMVWLASSFLLFYVGIEVSLGNWSYNFLVSLRREPDLLAGWIVSGYWLGLTVGRFVFNTVARRLGLGTVAMLYTSITGVVIGVVLLWLFPGVVVAALGFFLIGFCLGPIYPTTVALLPDLVPPHVVSNAIGFLVGVSVIGIAAFPWLAGVLAQYTGLLSLLPYTLALTLVMLGFWVAIGRGHPSPKAF